MGEVRGVSTCKTLIPRCISRPKTGENGRCGKGAGKVRDKLPAQTLNRRPRLGIPLTNDKN